MYLSEDDKKKPIRLIKGQDCVANEILPMDLFSDNQTQRHTGMSDDYISLH